MWSSGSAPLLYRASTLVCLFPSLDPLVDLDRRLSLRFNNKIDSMPLEQAASLVASGLLISDIKRKKMAKAEILIFALCSLSLATACFQLITPSKWGAKPANCSAPLKKLLPEYVVIIHTAGKSCNSLPDCSREVRNAQDYHLDLKGWCDIAYNFLIGEDGFVYEGRGWRSEGAHTYGYNDLTLGIAFIGTFIERSPNEKAWKALKCLLDFSTKVGYLDPDYLVVAHSDISSIVSPGEAVRAVISKWPNYKHH